MTNTNDSGAGSLRQALIDSGNGDTITFDASVFSVAAGPKTITLTTGALPFNIDCSSGTCVFPTTRTIPGPGAKLLTIDAGGTDRVFGLTGTSSFYKNLSISDLTLTHGSDLYGGLIAASSSSLNITRCVLTNGVTRSRRLHRLR